MEQGWKRDCTIRHLEREVEWWEHLVAACPETTSATTDDSVNQSHVDSVNELKSILDQMRGLGDAATDIGGSSIRDSLNAAEERIRELEFQIQATKNRKREDAANQRGEPSPILSG